MYGLVAWFYLQRFFSYPFELVAALLRRVLDITLLMLFWQAVSSSGSGQLQVRSLFGYFLVALAVGEITMGTNLRLAKALIESIKDGEITQHMIRPVRLLPYMYAYAMGNNGAQVGLSLLFLVAGFIIVPPASLAGAVGFVLTLGIAAVIAAAVNIAVGAVALKIVEAQNLRNVMIHVTRLLSGIMIPLSMFPGPWQTVVLMLPFSALAYGPATSLQARGWTEILGWHFWVSLGWAIGLLAFSLWLWKRMMRHYEAVGI